MQAFLLISTRSIVMHTRRHEMPLQLCQRMSSIALSPGIFVLSLSFMICQVMRLVNVAMSLIVRCSVICVAVSVWDYLMCITSTGCMMMIHVRLRRSVHIGGTVILVVVSVMDVFITRSSTGYLSLFRVVSRV